MKLKNPVLFSSFPLKLILAVTIFGSSCAFDTNRKDDRREKNDLIDEEIQEIQKTAANKCSMLQGFYTGSITTSTQPYVTEVGIYCEPKTIDKKDGLGNVVSVLTPFMVISRTEIYQRDKFKISFYQQTNEIANDGAPLPTYTGAEGTILESLQTNSFTGISGRADGSRIQAAITAQAPFGTLDVSRKAGEFKVDDQGDLEKIMKNLSLVLEDYKGKYCGHFKVRDDDQIGYFNAELIITVQKISDINYRVVGRFNVIDADGIPSTGVLDASTKLYFDFEKKFVDTDESEEEEEMVLKPLEGKTTGLNVDSVIVPGKYHFTMDARVSEDKKILQGIYLEDIGRVADFHMKKMQYSGKPPKKCFDDAKKKFKSKKD